MCRRRPVVWRLVAILVGLSITGLVAACGPGQSERGSSPDLYTYLLVKAPDAPLPVNQPVDVKSRTEDGDDQISHVELYAVELPTGETNVLIRSDPAPFDQTVFTASQVFVPAQPGHYVVKVVGYNKRGERAESDYIGFDVQ